MGSVHSPNAAKKPSLAGRGGGRASRSTYTFGWELAYERYAVERFKSTIHGDIRPVPARKAKTGSERKTKRATASQKVVREMRPERDELIVCAGLRVPGNGLKLWGDHLV